jgi:hypothetical protein
MCASYVYVHIIRIYANTYLNVRIKYIYVVYVQVSQYTHHLHMSYTQGKECEMLRRMYTYTYLNLRIIYYVIYTGQKTYVYVYVSKSTHHILCHIRRAKSVRCSKSPCRSYAMSYSRAYTMSYTQGKECEMQQESVQIICYVI